MAKGISSKLIAAESVTEGHPDKLCDQIADAILDEHLAQDPLARVGCEVMAAKNLIIIAGEISSTARVDCASIARRILIERGYVDQSIGIDGNSCEILLSLSQQSKTVADSIDHSLESKNANKSNCVDSIGAGDQAVLFGYACDETSEMLPLPVVLAHKLSRRLSEVRKSGLLPYLLPDGKSLIVISDKAGMPARATSILISAQHQPDITERILRQDIIDNVIDAVIPKDMITKNTQILVNPSGPWSLGGPAADTGLTGRKIAIDTYGGVVPFGGGALSGKDPTKIDRTGAYIARYIAKNVVASGLAQRIGVQITYGIGIANPLALTIDTYGSERINPNRLIKLVRQVFDIRPGVIINTLDLCKPIYLSTACYGHFGRDDMPWEKTDISNQLAEMGRNYR